MLFESFLFNLLQDRPTQQISNRIRKQCTHVKFWFNMHIMQFLFNFLIKRKIFLSVFDAKWIWSHSYSLTLHVHLWAFIWWWYKKLSLQYRLKISTIHKVNYAKKHLQVTRNSSLNTAGSQSMVIFSHLRQVVFHHFPRCSQHLFHLKEKNNLTSVK